ncbi:MAG: 4-alpha-glucanotransferase [Syntrophorhabdus sp. PtaU1.Bin153]|nr:MAG: 4-alpha-glucanotransferase [Syntrophorhabdus sp. PtaU1.Bin153]
MNKRGSGILLHITSLPSPYGIGDLGPEACAFVDFLEGAGQRCWQILPLNPIDPIYGNSPYSSVSAFAGNTLLISPDRLFEDGLLSRSDLTPIPLSPEVRCDFSEAIRYKNRVLERAYQNFTARRIKREPFEAFCAENSSWLEDFSLFVVLKKHLDGRIWNEWPKELRDRDPDSLRSVRSECAEELEKVKHRQYLFFRQWHLLKSYCSDKGIDVFGDLTIYLRFDSADVWANPGIFKLDSEKRPAFVSGVPPDYFSETGQLWNNPVYRWEVLRESGYRWWIERVAHHARLFNALRIDHFRGLVAYWEIPAGEKTAINGKWMEGPAEDFLNTVTNHFSSLCMVAEDLGTITPDVRDIMDRFGVPGMKVLMFAFGEDNPDHPYLPHTYKENCVVYTGTHDNNTVRGWFENEASSEEKRRLFEYLGKEVTADEVSWAFIRMAMMSAARWAIFPMQDVLGLGEGARMNKPSVPLGNWEWRLLSGQLSHRISESLREITAESARIPSQEKGS